MWVMEEWPSFLPLLAPFLAVLLWSVPLQHRPNGSSEHCIRLEAVLDCEISLYILVVLWMLSKLCKQAAVCSYGNDHLVHCSFALQFCTAVLHCKQQQPCPKAEELMNMP